MEVSYRKVEVDKYVIHSKGVYKTFTYAELDELAQVVKDIKQKESMPKWLQVLLLVSCLMVTFLSKPTQASAIQPPPSIALPIQNHSDATKAVLTDIECLTLNLYHEARSESILGQQAVAHVVMNRADDSRFPDTVCDVVFQKGWSRLSRRWVSHFSWTLDRKSDKVYEKEAYYIAHMIAVEVYAKLYQYDPTLGATHYHKTNIEPAWSFDSRMVVTVEEGLHRFYFYRR